MSGWKDVEDQIAARGSVYDVVRRESLTALSKYTNRNIILYYSGWLQKPNRAISADVFSITDADKSGFMAATHKMDKSKGLDLLLHTPGGDTGATESLGDYLRSMFGKDVRAIVPQLAMSAGTMLACACKEIVMGKHSSLGPIDPQFSGLAAQAVIAEFKRAKEEVSADPRTAPLWQVIISKYDPTFIGACEQAIQWSETMVRDWLLTGGMFDAYNGDKATIVEQITKGLNDHSEMKAHNRHISMEKATNIGLNITPLEDDETLQDLVLTVHHCCLHTLSDTSAAKIIENQNGMAVISDIRQL